MSETSNVISLATGQPMSEAEYEQRRAALRETYGDNRAEAGIRWEQALALLFFRSGWTQDHLALKEAKSQFWVSKQLLFGRFMAQSENISAGYILSERAFRGFWEKTDPKQTEHSRFREVERMIADSPPGQSDNIKAAIRRHYFDGKWHKPLVIAEDLDKPVEQVAKALEQLNRHSTSYKCERKGGRASYTYRFFKIAKPIGYEELVEKLTPLIQQLQAQAKAHPAQRSIATVGSVAADLQRLLDEWGE